MSQDKTACLRNRRKGSSKGSEDGATVRDSDKPKLQKAVSLAIARGGQIDIEGWAKKRALGCNNIRENLSLKW